MLNYTCSGKTFKYDFGLKLIKKIFSRSSKNDTIIVKTKYWGENRVINDTTVLTRSTGSASSNYL